MSILKYTLLIIALFLLAQCTNSEFDDLSGTSTLKGVVILNDTLSGTYNKSLAKNINVYLKKTDNISGFLYSTVTNAQGQYNFTGIDLHTAYTIYATVETDSLPYNGQLLYTANGFTDKQSDTLHLYPSFVGHNVLHVIVQDAQQGRVSGVTAWVFNSALLFAADTSAGRTYDMITNSNGISNKYNMAPGKWFLRVKTRIGNLSLSGEDTVDISATGIHTAFITLTQAPPANRNGIELTLWDAYQTPLANAQTYFYRSQSVFMADTTDYNNYLFMLPSNGAGLASTYVIDAATYFFRSVKPIGKDTLMAIGSVVVESNKIAKPAPIILE